MNTDGRKCSAFPMVGNSSNDWKTEIIDFFLSVSISVNLRLSLGVF